MVGYEKCKHCHLFIEDNYVADEDEGLAPFVHLHRGDEADEALDATHEAEPSGEIHTLDYWREHGPEAMRARFTEEN